MDTYGHLFPDDEDLGRGVIGPLITGAAEQDRTGKLDDCCGAGQRIGGGRVGL